MAIMINCRIEMCMEKGLQPRHKTSRNVQPEQRYSSTSSSYSRSRSHCKPLKVCKRKESWIVTDKYNAGCGSKYKKASTGQLESTFSYSTNLCTIHLLPDAAALIMPRVSVGKPAPDFTATAVMDGKLKGTCLFKSQCTSQY